jgi:predicted DNA-binding transcriptional regulator AlpA
MDDEYLDVKAACRFIGGTKPINPATLWRGVKAGRYSKPIKISPNAVRWRRSRLARDLERIAGGQDETAA